MRVQLLGIVVLAATLQLSAHSQQLAAAPIQAADSSTGPAGPPQHAVTPPKVSCKGNALTISANYSALGAILSEIQKCTGVQFDAPEMARSYLLFDEIGPGPANDVLATLLTASGFDYIIGASDTDPEKIEKIILLARTDEKDGSSPDSKGSSTLRKAFAQMREAARPHTPDEQAAAAAELEHPENESSGPSQPGKGVFDLDSAGKSENSKAASSPDAGATAQSSQPQTPQDPAAQAAASVPAAAMNSDTAASPAAPPPDAASSSRPPTANDDRIATMQTLFEQRRQMMQQQQQQTPHPAPH